MIDRQTTATREVSPRALVFSPYLASSAAPRLSEGVLLQIRRRHNVRVRALDTAEKGADLGFDRVTLDDQQLLLQEVERLRLAEQQAVALAEAAANLHGEKGALRWKILKHIAVERARQDGLHESARDDQHTPHDWCNLRNQEERKAMSHMAVGPAYQAVLRIAALAVAQLEAFERWIAATDKEREEATEVRRAQ